MSFLHTFNAGFAPTRRALFAGLAVALAMLPVSASAEGEGSNAKTGPDGDIAELMKVGDLPDFSAGAADAKVTIVEYASMTCPHCAKFHKEVYPGLKSKYIDTGKVRFLIVYCLSPSFVNSSQ